MPTFTTNFGLSKPLVNNATDQDLWGGEINGDMDELDTLLSTAINYATVPQTASFVVTAPTAGSGTTGGAKILYLCDATTLPMTVTLPAAATCSGMEAAFKKTDATASAVTVDANGAETIDGSTTYVLSAQNNFVVLVSNGSSWDIIAQSVPSNVALLNSPAFTGIPTAPTATANTNNTQIATTAYVDRVGLRAYAVIDSVGNLINAMNVTSVSHGGAGVYTVNFTTAFADANYSPNILTSSNGGTFTVVNAGTQTASTFQFSVQNRATGVGVDPTRSYINVFGV